MDTKYTHIAQMVARRIEKGDYATQAFPSARKLATDVGVSYLTARKAISHLAQTGTLEQLENGRMEIAQNPKRNQEGMRIAMLVPALQSFAFIEWFDCITHVVQNFGGTVRVVPYVHDNDHLITQTLGGDYDGFFLIPPAEISEPVKQQLQRMVGKVVVLWYDMTDMGHPRLDGGAFLNISKLMAHFHDLGCKRVDCLCTQKKRKLGSVDIRINHWEKALDHHQMSGHLWRWDEPEKLVSEMRAYELTQRMLDSDGPMPDALFCVTNQPVMGVYRCLYDAGLVVGKDIAVGSFGAPERSKLMVPSLTTINTGPSVKYVKQAVQWLLCSGQSKLKSMHLEPTNCKVLIGESSENFVPSH